MSGRERALIACHRLHAGMLALLVLAVLVPRAAANVPAPVAQVNDVREQAPGNPANGVLTTTVTYTDTAAAAVASTGNTIGLRRGRSFRLRTCVAFHLHGSTPLSECAEREVDTRSNAATVFTYAPPVTLSGQPRPTTQPWAYFYAYSDVLYLDAGIWRISAHSWPDDGLQDAGIAVVARDQESATLPANSTVTPDGAFNGAINSGQADSICTASPAASNGSPLPAGVIERHAAFAGAPTYYEVGSPSGTHVGEPPRGVMLVIHGGGWAVTGVLGVQLMRPDADRWRARGWATVNLTYRECGQSAEDVLWFYDRTRAWFGTATPVCALGTSAGGHLSLLIGARRPDLYCAVSQAGPTDLRTIQSEVAYDAATGLHNQTSGGRWVHNLAAAAFGAENLAAYSPAAQASASLKGTRVLQAFSADDSLVPFQQAADLAAAMRAADRAAYVDNVQLAIGTIPFAHGLVTQAALDHFHARERRLVAPLSAPTGTPSRRLAAPVP